MAVWDPLVNWIVLEVGWLMLSPVVPAGLARDLIRWFDRS